MRKIEIAMNQAVQSGNDFSLANTSVHHHEGVAIVRLHGNKIAEVGDNWMSLFDGGFQSTTTKSRLNALLAEFGHDCERVFAKNFTWFLQQEGGPIPFFSGMRLN